MKSERDLACLPAYRTYYLKESLKHISLVLQPTVPSFEYSCPDLPSSVHFIGPSRLARDPNYDEPAWWDLITSKRKKVILINQGTIAKNTNNLIKPAIEALRDEDVFVVAVPMTDGAIPNLPSNTFCCGFIPFGNLLPYVDLVITNGGYGGVQNALSYGIPLIVAGATEDKMEVAARVEYSQTGINLRTNHPEPHQIKKAVRKIFADSLYSQNARRLQKEMAGYNSMELAAELLERLAKSHQIRH